MLFSLNFIYNYVGDTPESHNSQKIQVAKIHTIIKREDEEQRIVEQIPYNTYVTSITVTTQSPYVIARVKNIMLLNACICIILLDSN